MEAPDFTITSQGDAIRIRINRMRLDAILSPRLKSEIVVLSGMGKRKLVLEMDACTYCDSSGLRAILVGNRLCQNANGILVLTGLTPAVERLIAISQLDRVLHIAYSEEQVEKMLSGSSPSN